MFQASQLNETTVLFSTKPKFRCRCRPRLGTWISRFAAQPFSGCGALIDPRDGLEQAKSGGWQPENPRENLKPSVTYNWNLDESGWIWMNLDESWQNWSVQHLSCVTFLWPGRLFIVWQIFREVRGVSEPVVQLNMLDLWNVLYPIWDDDQSI